MTPDFHRIDRLIKADPQAAWSALVEFIAADPPHLEAEMLLEDLMGRAGDRVITEIESETESNQRLAEVVAGADISDVSGLPADRFRALQRRTRDRLGHTYWEGWLPINPRDKLLSRQAPKDEG